MMKSLGNFLLPKKKQHKNESLLKNDKKWENCVMRVRVRVVVYFSPSNVFISTSRWIIFL